MPKFCNPPRYWRCNIEHWEVTEEDIGFDVYLKDEPTRVGTIVGFTGQFASVWLHDEDAPTKHYGGDLGWT